MAVKVMNSKYQFIILGCENPLKKNILDTFFHHTDELGISRTSIQVIDSNNFYDYYTGSSPSCCLYFGDENYNCESDHESEILRQLNEDGTLIIPIVNNLTNFSNLVPKMLEKVNGFELKTSENIERLVGCILESFNLLRVSRRLFISYKRDESSSAAIQLFERLEKAGFDVFLDTHSIRPGEPFQEELWHRLADSDIVVLLNTPSFLKSEWTIQEIENANKMSIGILQLIWPNSQLERGTELNLQFKLSNKDFENEKFENSKCTFIDSTISKIIESVESLRARSLASRQDTLVTEFLNFSKKTDTETTLQYHKWIKSVSKTGKHAVIIPTIGVPQAFTYYKCKDKHKDLLNEIECKDAQVFLLYDHINIKENWMKHLEWLDTHLPVKTLRIIDAEGWLHKW